MLHRDGGTPAPDALGPASGAENGNQDECPTFRRPSDTPDAFRSFRAACKRLGWQEVRWDRPKPVRKCVESNLSDRLPRLYITVAVRRQMFILPDLAAGRCDARGFFHRFCRRPLKHKSGPASGRAPILKTAVGWDRIGVCSVALPRHRRPRAGLQTAPRRHSGSKMNFCPPMEASYISPPLLWTKTAIPLT